MMTLVLNYNVLLKKMFEKYNVSVMRYLCGWLFFHGSCPFSQTLILVGVTGAFKS